MTENTDPAGTGSEELDTAAAVRWLTTAAASIEREADRLTELDSPIGDADHGSNMRRGFAAATAALEEDPPATPGAALTKAGSRLVSTVGGASGPLYGTLLRRIGKALGSAEHVTRQQMADALRTGVDAVGQLGGAVAGEATMLDALLPAVEALSTAPDAPYEAARRAADEGALATVPMTATKGRASYLGPRSIGHQDPGATSSALLIGALADTVAAE